MKFTLDEFDTSLLTHELHYLNELMMIVPHWAIKEEVKKKLI